MMPSLIMQICLSILLIILTTQASIKAKEIFKKENFKIAQAKREKNKLMYEEDESI